MEILDFDRFKKSKLILEQDDPLAGGPPPPAASPATDTPPPPPMSTPDLGMSPTLPPDPNAPQAPLAVEEPKDFRFVFIQDAAQKKWYGQSDQNGGVKRFTVYQITPDDLETWLAAHKDEANSELVKAALTGKRPMPSSVYSDFKREVIDGTLGTDNGPIDVTFDSDKDFDNPATDDLSVVFLRSGK